MVKCNIRRLCHDGRHCHLLVVYWSGCKMVRHEVGVAIRSNTSVKIAPFGRWTPQKRGALYLNR